MKIPKRISRIFNKIAVNHWTYSFEKNCHVVGKNTIIKGPFRLRNAGRVEIGQDCIFDSTQQKPILLEIGTEANLTFGDNVYVNEGFYLVCNISVSIGSRVLIAPDVVIIDDDGHPLDWAARHDYWPKTPQDRLERKIGAPIIIEDNVWIGTRAIILKGVTIGEGSVIAAGAVVIHSIPGKVLAGGVPAHAIRNL